MMRGQAKGTSARRLVGWTFSIAAALAMGVAFLVPFATPAAAANPLVVTISLPTSPPAPDSTAVPLDSNYSVNVNVTLNGSSNWDTSGGFMAFKQVRCFAESPSPSSHYYVNYVTIKDGTGTFSFNEQTEGTDTVTCYAYDYSNGHYYGATSNSESITWVSQQNNGGGGNNGPTATLSAIASCPNCNPTITPATEISMPVGSQARVDATMMNQGSPVSGQTLYFSLESGSATPSADVPSSGTTGLSGTTSIYYTNNNPGTDTLDVTNDDLTPATVTIHWTASTNFTLFPSSQTALVTQHPQVTANLKINGVAVQGASVTLAATGGGPNNGATRGPTNTSVTGSAIFNVSDIAGASGTDTLTATATYGGNTYTSNTATIAWQKPTAYSVTLKPNSQTIAVNQPGELASVTATISPTPPSGSFLMFKVMSGPNAGNSKSQLINGNSATWSYNDSSTGTGTDVVQAVSITPFGNPAQSVSSNSVNVNWGGATAGITVDLEPSTAQALLGHRITFIATATQANGLAAAGVGVGFTVSGPNSDKSLSTVTDNNGQATFSYVDAHATNGQTDTITVQLQSGPSKTATVEWVATSSQSIKLCVETSTGPCSTGGNAAINQSATVTALVTMSGVPQQGAEVTFTGIAGSNHPLSTTVLTDANGEANFSYVGGVTGTDTIQATTPAAATAATATIDWQAGNRLQFIQGPTTGTVGTANTYKVQLTDGSGGAVSNTTVTFTARDANGNKVAGKTTTTNNNGRASFRFDAPSAGTFTIEADSAGVPSAYTTTTWSMSNGGGTNPGAVTKVTLQVSSSSPYVYFGSETITATVTVDGAPATFGTPITFTVQGANSQTFTGTAGNGGVATFTYTGHSTGKDTITANANGVTSSPVSVNWRWFF